MSRIVVNIEDCDWYWWYHERQMKSMWGYTPESRLTEMGYRPQVPIDGSDQYE